MSDSSPSGPSGPGPGVDASGRPVRDPSPNVLDLVRAETRRQDDLRALTKECAERESDLRAEYDEKLRHKETARLDAIRAVDVATGQRASEVSAEAVRTLAAQVPITAEAVRTTLAAALNPIQSDIQELRKAQYEQQGQRTQQAETKVDTGTSSNLRVAIVIAAIAAMGLFVSIAAVIVTVILTGS